MRFRDRPEAYPTLRFRDRPEACPTLRFRDRPEACFTLWFRDRPEAYPTLRFRDRPEACFTLRHKHNFHAHLAEKDHHARRVQRVGCEIFLRELPLCWPREFHKETRGQKSQHTYNQADVQEIFVHKSGFFLT